MADTKTQITGPVEVLQTSKHAVALQLLQKVAQYEDVDLRDRKYWITLYGQCLRVVNGHEPSDALNYK